MDGRSRNKDHILEGMRVMRNLFVVLLGVALLVSGCTGGGVLSGKAEWGDYLVKDSNCMGIPCISVNATLRNTGKGILAFGSFVAYAYDSTGSEVGRNSSWAFKVLDPGETTQLHIAIPGVTLDEAATVQLILVQTATDTYNPANHTRWKLLIPVGA